MNHTFGIELNYCWTYYCHLSKGKLYVEFNIYNNLFLFSHKRAIKMS